ncbi:MAG: hypothetical protein AB7F43_13600 [Bacteriovoracia bacterium]
MRLTLLAVLALSINSITWANTCPNLTGTYGDCVSVVDGNSQSKGSKFTISQTEQDGITTYNVLSEYWYGGSDVASYTADNKEKITTEVVYRGIITSKETWRCENNALVLSKYQELDEGRGVTSKGQANAAYTLDEEGNLLLVFDTSVYHVEDGRISKEHSESKCLRHDSKEIE